MDSCRCASQQQSHQSASPSWEVSILNIGAELDRCYKIHIGAPACVHPQWPPAACDRGSAGGAAGHEGSTTAASAAARPAASLKPPPSPLPRLGRCASIRSRRPSSPRCAVYQLHDAALALIQRGELRGLRDPALDSARRAESISASASRVRLLSRLSVVCVRGGKRRQLRGCFLLSLTTSQSAPKCSPERGFTRLSLLRARYTAVASGRAFAWRGTAAGVRGDTHARDPADRQYALVALVEVGSTSCSSVRSNAARSRARPGRCGRGRRRRKSQPLSPSKASAHQPSTALTIRRGFPPPSSRWCRSPPSGSAGGGQTSHPRVSRAPVKPP